MSFPSLLPLSNAHDPHPSASCYPPQPPSKTAFPFPHPPDVGPLPSPSPPRLQPPLPPFPPARGSVDIPLPSPATTKPCPPRPPMPTPMTTTHQSVAIKCMSKLEVLRYSFSTNQSSPPQEDELHVLIANTILHHSGDDDPQTIAQWRRP